MKETSQPYYITSYGYEDKLTPQLKPNWKSWLISKPFDWVATAIYLANCIMFFANPNFQKSSADHNSWWKGLLVISGVLCLAFIDRAEVLIFRENISTPVAIGLTAFRIAIIVLVSFLTQDANSYVFGAIILTVTSSYYFGMRGAYISGFGSIAFSFLLFPYPEKLDPSILWTNSVLYSILLILVFTFAKMTIEEKVLRHKAVQLVQALDESQHQIAKLAVTEERNRLAREIHDSLGHYLTVVNVQLEKAQAFRDRNPLEADKAIDNAKQLANEALEEVRRSVGTLRVIPQTFSLEQALTKLVENSQSHLLRVELEIEGNENGVSDQVLDILYRAVQEGLTNIQRHAKASQAKITLRFNTANIFLSISDNGRGFEAAASQHTGYGLTGLQERLALIGGNLRVASNLGNGTQLQITIPGKSKLSTK